MRQRHRFIQLMLLVASLSGLGIVSPTQADEPDPASRLARISYLHSNVLIQAAGADEWAEAHLNRPLTSQDQIWTEEGARAELQLGRTVVQLDRNTQLSILELSDTALQLQLSQGVLILQIHDMDDSETIEVDTPNAAVTLPQPGTYRIEVADHDDLTAVQVRAGDAEVYGERQSFSVRENERLSLRGTTRLNAQFDDLDHLDEFDQWSANRYSQSQSATASRYVDDDVIGYEDLDNNGYWQWESGYGEVWYPTRVVSEWAPYRYGHWDWIAPWGWTWVDDAAWGFAPFHYGRWAQVHQRWCWVPGPRGTRAVYAPALVAWVGSPGVNISIKVGNTPVGWIPLGPHEIYRPAYKVSGGYLAHVNLSNSLLNQAEFERGYRRHPHDEVFANRGAVSVVVAGTLRSASTVNHNLMHVDSRQLEPVETGFELRPDTAALRGNAHAVTPPSQLLNRDVVARRTPLPVFSTGNGESGEPNHVANHSSLRLIQPAAGQHWATANRREDQFKLQRGSNTSPQGSTNVEVSPGQDGNHHGRWSTGERLENRNTNAPVISSPQDRSTGSGSSDNWRNQQRDENRAVVTPGFNSRFNRSTNVTPPEARPEAPPPATLQTPEPHVGTPSSDTRQRIGPWVHDEGQLGREQHAPRTAPSTEPPPHVDPPAQPPPRNNPDDDDHRRDLLERAKVR